MEIINAKRLSDEKLIRQYIDTISITVVYRHVFTFIVKLYHQMEIGINGTFPVVALNISHLIFQSQIEII